MGRPRTRDTKVELLPVTRQLLLALPDDATQRDAIFVRAGVPRSSFFNWQNGVNHPTTRALDLLAGTLGKQLVLVDVEPPDAADQET